MDLYVVGSGVQTDGVRVLNVEGPTRSNDDSWGEFIKLFSYKDNCMLEGADRDACVLADEIARNETTTGAERKTIKHTADQQPTGKGKNIFGQKVSPKSDRIGQQNTTVAMMGIIDNQLATHRHVMTNATGVIPTDQEMRADFFKGAMERCKRSADTLAMSASQSSTVDHDAFRTETIDGDLKRYKQTPESENSSSDWRSQSFVGRKSSPGTLADTLEIGGWNSMQANLQNLKQVKAQGGSVKEFVSTWKSSVESTGSQNEDDRVPKEVVRQSNSKIVPSADSKPWFPSFPPPAVLPSRPPVPPSALQKDHEGIDGQKNDDSMTWLAKSTATLAHAHMAKRG